MEVNTGILNSYETILGKLGVFTRKYYYKQLVRGVLLFLTFGLLFWMAILSLEYALWMNEDWRFVMFAVFLLVEGFLVYKFIFVPIGFLIGLKKGISNKEASKLIQKHFPNVSDKLYNLLDLAENKRRSELLLASIEQRASSLGVVPFSNAVKFGESYSYAKYIIIPLGIVVLIWVSGNIGTFFGSHKRLVNYDVAYAQPAPFTFEVLNGSLEVLDSESLVLRIGVDGEVKPDRVYMVLHGEEILLREDEGIFSYTFVAPIKESTFYLTAQGWDSRNYTVRSLTTPSLTDFRMKFNFPDYLERDKLEVSGTGNAVIPEGTTVVWNIKGRNVEKIDLITKDSSSVFVGNGDIFTHSSTIGDDLEYELSTSNDNVKGFERLGYFLEVVKDEYPAIEVEQVLDPVSLNQSFYTGQVGDDHKVASINVVCFPVDNVTGVQRMVLGKPNKNVEQFYYTFPSGFVLKEGKRYRIYFEVVDNDGLRGGKMSKSRVFDVTMYNDKELVNRELEHQNNLLNSFDKSLDGYKKQQEELKNINELQREVNELSFENKNQLKDFLNKQEKQEEMMEQFSKQFSKSLDKSEGDEQMKKMLQERLERQELEAKKNKKLLEEINALADKIEKEELKSKLEEFGKKQNSNARSLEQILELTKRYYVTEKMRQLARELDDLSKRQEHLSKVESSEESLEQEELNKSFDELSDDLDELRKDNELLQKPMEVEPKASEQNAIKKDQKDALEELNNRQPGDSSTEGDVKKGEKKAAQKQKSAADKMEEMGKKLQQNAMGGGASTMAEDAEMLRQILDNLVTFSFKEEGLLDSTSEIDANDAQFSKSVRDQKELRRLFEHVDDSLFALSLRRAELSEFVNEQITEVYYNIDKSLESIAENQMFQAASYQQYVVNATNALGDFLANILDNMQQNMKPGQGSGQGGADFQLPDIIKGQQSIQEQMGGSGKQGKEQSGEVGEDGGKGDGEQEGREGDEGRESSAGKNGKEKGSSGAEGGNGEGEMGLEEVYEIYKQQQLLRERLEKQLEDFMDNSDRSLAKKLLRQMEDFENDLLENGITERTRNKVNTIQHELLKLENAALKQGEKEERESNVNERKFNNPIITKPDLFNRQGSNIEILNRQALPLRQNYGKKVKVYFKNDSISF